ncbi:MAG: copper chaperone PCu(A)C [Rhodospirillales bacterium]|nr:copper chaperone PCu(A)C [Rhodospirillales bacterium]MDH3968579.1 copper chaperone PCu(A)C [Rhodospirillales bacterium]
MKSFLIAAVAVSAALLTAPAFAQDFEIGNLRVEQPWARATPGRVPNGAVYMTLTNQGATADRLIGASSPAAKHAGLHSHSMEGGVMKMRPVKAMEVTPGSPTVLAPGGLHIMLMGLTAPLKEGARFSVTLTFERAGSLEIEVTVEKLGAMQPSHRKHGS